MNKKENNVGAGPVSAQKGITLIALVITIIVMLILVAVTITMAVNGGLFDYAGRAAGKTKNELSAEQQLAESGVEVNANWYASIDEYLEKNGYEVKMLEGDGQVFHSLAPSPLVFRSNAPVDTFKEVKVNGEVVDESYYTITEGSTVVTFSIDYLKTLNKGIYSVEIVSEAGSAKGNFDIVIPETNEHGFYYNQPYTAYVDDFGSNCTIFVREDGTLDAMVGNDTETCTYTVEGNKITISSSSMGTLNFTISEDGTTVYNTEFAANFVLSDESVVADEDYIYTYDSSLGGYVVRAIDPTKASYEPIRTGINECPTVKFADYMFVDFYVDSNAGNPNLVVAPVIPNTVTIIGKKAFCFCTSLTGVTIPKSVTSIEDSAFLGCTSLESITFEGTVEQWGAISIGGWKALGNATEVVCSDGTVKLQK